MQREYNNTLVAVYKLYSFYSNSRGTAAATAIAEDDDDVDD